MPDNVDFKVSSDLFSSTVMTPFHADFCSLWAIILPIGSIAIRTDGCDLGAISDIATGGALLIVLDHGRHR